MSFQQTVPIASQTNFLSINLPQQPSISTLLKSLTSKIVKPVARYQTTTTSTFNPGFIPFKRQTSEFSQ